MIDHVRTKQTVTPDMARDWLAKSKGNRNVRPTAVGAYAIDMKNGNWVYNGDVIRFMPDGSLYDGHHRLEACVKAGVPFVTDIMVISDEAKNYIDKGRPRTVADNLVFGYGIKSNIASIVSATIKMIINHDETGITDWISPSSQVWGTGKYNVENINRYYNEIGNLLACEAEEYCSLKGSDKLISSAQYCAIKHLAKRTYNDELVDRFSRRVLTGYSLIPGSTEDLCRNVLIAVKMKQRKLKLSDKGYTFAKCLRSVCSGRTISNERTATFRKNVDNIPRFDK